MSEVLEDRRRGLVGLQLRDSKRLGGLPNIIGYAAVYDSWSEQLPTYGGMFREIITPGAFTTVLASKPDIRAFRDHDSARVLGRTPETLRINEDDRGLRVEITPPDTELGRETVELIRRGDVDGMSFAFRVPEGGAEWSEDGSERTVNEIAEVAEVSIVSFPAYADTVADVTRSKSDTIRSEFNTHRLERLESRGASGK